MPCTTAATRRRYAALRALIRVYTIDLPDPTAIEVLLVVDELLDVLGMSPRLRAKLLGKQACAVLDQWDTLVGPTPGVAPVGLTPWAGRKPPRRRVRRDETG